MTCRPEIKELLKRAVRQHRGDDLIRARIEFENYTEEQMNTYYGASNNTPRQILDDYEDHSKLCDEALAFIECLNTQAGS